MMASLEKEVRLYRAAVARARKLTAALSLRSDDVPQGEVMAARKAIDGAEHWARFQSDPEAANRETHALVAAWIAAREQARTNYRVALQAESDRLRRAHRDSLPEPGTYLHDIARLRARGGL